MTAFAAIATHSKRLKCDNFVKSNESKRLASAPVKKKKAAGGARGHLRVAVRSNDGRIAIDRDTAAQMFDAMPVCFAETYPTEVIEAVKGKLGLKPNKTTEYFSELRRKTGWQYAIIISLCDATDPDSDLKFVLCPSACA